VTRGVGYRECTSDATLFSSLLARDVKRGRMLEAKAEAKFKEVEQNNVLLEYLT